LSGKEAAMNDLVLIEDIQRATGLHQRSVLRWLSRLSIQPSGMRGKLHLYKPETVAFIQASMLQAEAARKEAIRKAKAKPRIITVKEAKRRAGKGGKG
jgi:hypothetical protein